MESPAFIVPTRRKSCIHRHARASEDAGFAGQTPMSRRDTPTVDEAHDPIADQPAMPQRLGANLRSARMTAGVTQLGLARLAKMPRSVVGKIERGEQNLTLHTITRLADSLGTTERALLLGGAPLAPCLCDAIEVVVAQAIARHLDACKAAGTLDLSPGVTDRLKRLARREIHVLVECPPAKPKA